MSSICGGVMSHSHLMKGMKKYGIYYGMMAFVMPDKQFKEYAKLRKVNKEKEAEKLFDRYAVSQI